MGASGAHGAWRHIQTCHGFDSEPAHEFTHSPENCWSRSWNTSQVPPTRDFFWSEFLAWSPSRSFPRENKFSLWCHPKLEVCQTQGASRLAHNRPKFPPGHRVPHGCGTPSTAMRSIATALRAAPEQWKRWICSRSAPEHEIHLLGCILLMVWAGLRFADAQRTCPSSLLRDRHVLRGEHWRTKVSGSGQSFGALAFLVFQDVLHAGVGTMCVSMRFAAGTPVW